MRCAQRILPLLALGLLIAAPPVRGAVCAFDGGPAATLLLPYFEVDLATQGGRTTLLSINNAGEKAVLAHLVFWTDTGVPTLILDVYLTGYDVQTLNLRDVFLEGRLPKTADLARDPGDLISPRGDFSQDSTFPNCGLLPFSEVIPANLVEAFRRAHSGRPSVLFNDQCAGLDLGEPLVVRCYVTIDAVKDCNLKRPGDPGYFGPDGLAAFDNVLWGDFYLVDVDGRFAQGEGLVGIEADPARFKAGDATFYGRFVDGSAADGREPLPRRWASRFANGGVFSGGTRLLAWRDGPWTRKPFPCGPSPSPPPGVPQTQKQLLVFDEEETAFDAMEPEPCQILCPPAVAPTPFPAAATAVQMADGILPVPFEFGWLLADLGIETAGQDDPQAQAWVGQVHSAEGRFSVGFEATSLDGLCGGERCSEGSAAEIGQLCVLGPLAADQPARFEVRPKGCFSSGCTQRLHTGCAVERSGSELRLDALFCLAATATTPRTEDCGGGSAQCSSGPLGAGAYTATLGSLALDFQVPGTGSCVGTP
jgi:hypothetical protein